ncbi:MAG: acyltransferase [Alphaproteobacteria bacterium]|nr:acyltransferase [Alphaproteobacteria bacterium]
MAVQRRKIAGLAGKKHGWNEMKPDIVPSLSVAKSESVLPGIQILRGVAAFLVLFHHVLEESQPLFGGAIPSRFVLLGACGVDIFFAISGFIILHTVSRKIGMPGVARDFMARRIIRIAPLYWLCSAGIVGLHALGLYAHKIFSFAIIVSSLFFMQHKNILLNVGWTLNYEMYFYVAMGLCLYFASSLRTVVAGTIITILGIFCGAWGLSDVQAADFFRNPIVIEFCFGMLVALLFKKGVLPQRRSFFVLIAATAGFIAASLWGQTDGTTAGLAQASRFWQWGLPSVLLLVPALLWNPARYTGTMKLMLLLGDASYAIYLTHPFVMVSYAKLIKTHAPHGAMAWACVPLPILVSLIIGIAVHLRVEKPMTAFLNQWWAAKRA